MSDERCLHHDASAEPGLILTDYGKCPRCGTPNSRPRLHGYTSAGYACPTTEKEQRKGDAKVSRRK
jgi:hypothetical protein